jgi:DNA-directed RNA polymerase specialized sigma24 family protein
MAGAARRDPEAIATVHVLLAPRLRQMIRSDLREIGVHPDADRLHDLVEDAFVAILERAGQWRPDGGAHPCRWLRASILANARRSLGFFAEELDVDDDRFVAAAAPPTADDVIDLADRVAYEAPEVRLLLDALHVASERDRRVFLRVAEEQGVHNRHAAVTVAAEEGLRPAAVRQICRRARVRLTELARSDAAYAELVSLPVLAA